MKNKVELKKSIMASIVVSLVFIVLFMITFKIEYEEYTSNFNGKISGIVSKILEQYPEVEKSDLMALLNNKEDVNKEIFREYGIDLNQDSVVLENDNIFNQFVLLKIILIVTLFIVLLIIFLKYNYNKDKKIE